MRVGLMTPCYLDMIYPQVAVATLDLLEKLGRRGRLTLRPGLQIMSSGRFSPSHSQKGLQDPPHIEKGQ